MIQVGHIKEAKGLKGDLVLVLYSKNADWIYDGLKLEFRAPERLKGEPSKELEVEDLWAQNEKLILRIKGVGDRNQADALRGWTVWASEENFVSEKGENIFLGEILGFDIYDKDDLVGKVEGFSSNGVQDLIVVKAGGKHKEILIPLIEAFIRKIDFETSSVEMDLPEGLLTVEDMKHKPDDGESDGGSDDEK